MDGLNFPGGKRNSCMEDSKSVAARKFISETAGLLSPETKTELNSTFHSASLNVSWTPASKLASFVFELPERDWKVVLGLAFSFNSIVLNCARFVYLCMHVVVCLRLLPCLIP